MPDRRGEAIAGLIIQLPLFMGILLEGICIHTEAKLTLSEGKTLMYIRNHEGQNMTEYSKKVGLARGSFTAVADSLEEKGLLGRVPGSNDRRKYALVLTEEGERISREIDAQFKRHITARLAGLAGDELGDLEEALGVIVTAVEKLNSRGN